jgi:hypothetical protein
MENLVTKDGWNDCPNVAWKSRNLKSGAYRESTNGRAIPMDRKVSKPSLKSANPFAKTTICLTVT